MIRKIIHIDMDAFYASVEQRDHPELRGKPVAVGGSSARGVVAAASYEARKFGVHSAMPSVMAKKRCPHLIFVRGRLQVYREISMQIREIFKDYTDLVEPLSFDEAYLDVTENKKNIPSATFIAQQIKQQIFTETQLTASAGVSYNKFLAKTASDVNKPNGIFVITPDEAQDFINKLKIEKFFGIGKVTTQKLHNMGVFFGADLKKLSESRLIKSFGKAGGYYYHIVRGIDQRKVNPHRERKSVGVENTFSSDLTTKSAMLNALKPISETVYQRLQKTNKLGRTLTLKIKFSDFQVITRSVTLPTPLFTYNELWQQTEALLNQAFQPQFKVRLLGVSVSNFLNEEQEAIQLEINWDNQID